MKILVLSDTHFRSNFSVYLSENVKKHIAICDKIIHCGDFQSIEFYNFLKSTGKLIAVRGNNDYKLPREVPLERTEEILDKKISILHGHTQDIDFLHHHFEDSDIIIYGHLHHPEKVETDSGQLILSPGSYSFNRYVNFESYVTLELEVRQEPKVEFITINRH